MGVIQEKGGDGIMSAIDFDMSVDKIPNPKGDRVEIKMSKSFCPIITGSFETRQPKAEFSSAAVGGYLPAHRAAKLNPVDIIRRATGRIGKSTCGWKDQIAGTFAGPIKHGVDCYKSRMLRQRVSLSTSHSERRKNGRSQHPSKT
jgi:hypothetical protein